MAEHHGHHGHPRAMINTTESLFTTVPTVTTTLLQTLLTTVMAQQNHHGHHSSPEPNSPSHFVNSNFHTTDMDSSKIDHSAHSGESAYGHNMIMYFHSGVDVKILFKEWNVSTSEGLVGSVFAIFFMAMLYEGIKFFREHMFKKYFTSLEYSSVSVLGDDGKTVTEVHKVARNRMFSWPHLVQTALHVVQMVLSYFLMLIFMTYNIWLCLGVVLGAGTGYFLFGWKKATVIDITEHCH